MREKFRAQFLEIVKELFLSTLELRCIKIWDNILIKEIRKEEKEVLSEIFFFGVNKR